jgi:biopolymer transport protein ExbD
MRRRRSGRLDDEAEVDLTPMLDVVFIMLIFFIVTASDRRVTDIRAVRPNIERLHAERPNGSVIIAPSAASFNGLLVEIMDQARLAGVENISLAAEVN